MRNLRRLGRSWCTWSKGALYGHQYIRECGRWTDRGNGFGWTQPPGCEFIQKGAMPASSQQLLWNGQQLPRLQWNNKKRALYLGRVSMEGAVSTDEVLR